MADVAEEAKTLRLYRKILTGVLSAPEEAKFRRVNVQKLLSKLRTQHLLVLLLSAGFEHDREGLMDGAEPTHLVLPQSASLDSLQAAVEAIPTPVTVTQTQAKPEDAEKAARREEALRIIQENNKKVQAMKADKAQRRQKLNRRAKENQAAVKDKIIVDSVGTKVKFGCTMGKLPDKKGG